MIFNQQAGSGSGVKRITSNGTYDVSAYAQVTVAVPQPEPEQELVEVRFVGGDWEESNLVFYYNEDGSVVDSDGNPSVQVPANSIVCVGSTTGQLILDLNAAGCTSGDPVECIMVGADFFLVPVGIEGVEVELVTL